MEIFIATFIAEYKTFLTEACIYNAHFIYIWKGNAALPFYCEMLVESLDFTSFRLIIDLLGE